MKFLNVFFLASLLSLAACSTIETDEQKLSAWSNTNGGKTVLAGVDTAAALFAPAYAGLIGEAIYSLQSGTIPTPAATASILASVTGNSRTAAKVTVLASAVIQAAQQAPTPNIGLSAAAATVNGAVK